MRKNVPLVLRGRPTRYACASLASCACATANRPSSPNTDTLSIPKANTDTLSDPWTRAKSQFAGRWLLFMG
jgi:hypothetical protein